MAKTESNESNENHDALIIPPESTDSDDSLVLLPKKPGNQEALVLLPENEQEGETLVLLPENEDGEEALVLLPENEDEALVLFTESEGEELEEEEEEDEEGSQKPRHQVKLPDEKKARANITDKTIKRVWKKRADVPDWRKMSIDSVFALPARVALMRRFIDAVNWKQAQEEVLEGLANTVVIVGQPNTGKSTLFNHLKGKVISEVSPQAGTTKELIRTDFGPFTLVDTPGHLEDATNEGIEEASLVVLMVDGEKGLRFEDRNLLMTIREMKKPVIVAVNKIDALKSLQDGDALANDVARRLGIAGVIPISALTGTNVAEELIPAMVSSSPEAALVIGHELPAYRRQAAQRIIRNATLVSLAAGLEPIPLIDIPILIGTQVRLVLRLAALYGEPIDSAEAFKHARELLITMASGLGLRYLAEQAAKAVPFGGDIIAGIIAAAATWSIGKVALEYYDGGKHLNSGTLRSMTNSFYHSFRQQNSLESLRKGTISEGNEPLAVEQDTENRD